MAFHSSALSKYVYFKICEEQAGNNPIDNLVMASHLLSCLFKLNNDAFQGESKERARYHSSRGKRLPVKFVGDDVFFFQGCPTLFSEGLTKIFGDSADITLQPIDNQFTDLHKATNPGAKKAEFNVTVKSVRGFLRQHNLL